MDCQFGPSAKLPRFHVCRARRESWPAGVLTTQRPPIAYHDRNDPITENLSQPIDLHQPGTLQQAATNAGYVTAILALVGSAVYGICAAAFALKLWTLNQDWATVVPSLPRALVLSRGIVGTIIPSLALA